MCLAHFDSNQVLLVCNLFENNVFVLDLGAIITVNYLYSLNNLLFLHAFFTPFFGSDLNGWGKICRSVLFRISFLLLFELVL